MNSGNCFGRRAITRPLNNGRKASRATSLPGNYYNAARYYYLTTDRVWSLIWERYS